MENLPIRKFSIDEQNDDDDVFVFVKIFHDFFIIICHRCAHKHSTERIENAEKQEKYEMENSLFDKFSRRKYCFNAISICHLVINRIRCTHVCVCVCVVCSSNRLSEISSVDCKEISVKENMIYLSPLSSSLCMHALHSNTSDHIETNRCIESRKTSDAFDNGIKIIWRQSFSSTFGRNGLDDSKFWLVLSIRFVVFLSNGISLFCNCISTWNQSIAKHLKSITSFMCTNLIKRKNLRANIYHLFRFDYIFYPPFISIPPTLLFSLAWLQTFPPLSSTFHFQVNCIVEKCTRKKRIDDSLTNTWFWRLFEFDFLCTDDEFSSAATQKKYIFSMREICICLSIPSDAWKWVTICGN